MYLRSLFAQNGMGADWPLRLTNTFGHCYWPFPLPVNFFWCLLFHQTEKRGCNKTYTNNKTINTKLNILYKKMNMIFVQTVGLPWIMTPYMTHHDLQTYLRKFRYEDQLRDKVSNFYQLFQTISTHISRFITPKFFNSLSIAVTWRPIQILSCHAYVFQSKLNT